jgi:hypothetical protein
MLSIMRTLTTVPCGIVFTGLRATNEAGVTNKAQIVAKPIID